MLTIEHHCEHNQNKSGSITPTGMQSCPCSCGSHQCAPQNKNYISGHGVAYYMNYGLTSSSTAGVSRAYVGVSRLGVWLDREGNLLELLF